MMRPRASFSAAVTSKPPASIAPPDQLLR
jgi:hypothetical protein